MTETQTTTPFDVIDKEVTSWPEVTAVTGSRGEHRFRLGKREIGHLHGSRVAHFGFPKKVWQELFDAGRITYHPVFPRQAGLRSPSDRVRRRRQGRDRPDARELRPGSRETRTPRRGELTETLDHPKGGLTPGQTPLQVG